MCSNVDGESTTLDEAFATSRCVARVGTFIGMDSVMSLKIRLSVEALAFLLAATLVIEDTKTYLIACLPITLEGSGVRLIFH